MRYLLIHKTIKMKFLINGFVILLVLFTIVSCNKDEIKSIAEPEAVLNAASNFTYANDQVLIQAVQDSIQQSIFATITANAGQPQWQCAYVEHSGFQFSKVVVPYRNMTTGEIENLLVAFHFELNNSWKVQLVNKYYYLMMHDITKYDINREYYFTIIEEFEKADSICVNTSNTLAQVRLKNVMIVFDDGTIVWIDGQGRAWIIAGGGGCVSGSSTAGAIWSDSGGKILWTPGNNSTLGPKWNGKGSGGGISGNWNGSNNNGTGVGNNSGNSEGGGGSSTTAPTCQDPSFWSSIHPRIKKDYVKTLSNLINQYDVLTCANANTPAEQSNCISDTDLLCLGLNNGCLQIVGNQFDVNHFTDCMGAVFHRLPCMDEAENFINTYGLNVTIEELESMAGGFGNHCNDQHDFDIATFTNIINNSIWLNQTENTNIKQHIDAFLTNNPNDVAALIHAYTQIENMKNDGDYKALVESSFGWSGIMWTIVKELVGDKAVDIIIGLIPGFGNVDELKDAIKAAKNGDWIEFTFEVGKIVGQNTPWGKMLKIGEAGSEMYQFCKKIEKIWDKIGTWTTSKTEQIWNIVKKNIKLASNSDFWKYVDDLAQPKFGSYFATSNTYAQNFKSKFSEVYNEIGQVHHAVPQAVLNKYPNLNITQDMMHSLENLRGIPSNGTLNHQTITNIWSQFYSNYPNATLQQILNKAKDIDDTYGHLFVPPVR